MYTFTKQSVAIIGATGQIGTPLTKKLLALGHNVIILHRSLSGKNSEKLSAYKAQGAQLIEVPDMLNLDQMTAALKDVETLISAVPGSKEIITKAEPLWLEAALKAGVKRFVPTEFGCHTRNLDEGDGILFDYKKALHKKIMESGIGWTFFYNGGIFDYFLPNLRFFRKITTFGDMELPIYTHDIEDIGYIAALALTDDRTLNQCVQMDLNVLTQTKMIELLKANFPEHKFEYEHFSSEFITEARNTAGDEITAKKGAETDRERWGINYVIYVIGKLASFTDETLRISQLYPDYQVSRTPEQAIADPEFIFDN